MDTVCSYELGVELLRLGQFFVVARNMPDEEWRSCIALTRDHPESVFIAVGANYQQDMDRIQEVLDIKYNVAYDVAHGHSDRALEAYRIMAKNPRVRYVMSGSIATAEAAIESVMHGTTYIRVGIGPGAMCTTRQMTGVGVTQLQAVQEIKQALDDRYYYKDHRVIADGGIKQPGDAVKYLAAGADAIMLGSVLSKTKESPGWQVGQVKNGGQLTLRDLAEPPLVKTYRGHASAEFQQDHFGRANRCPEGQSSRPFTYQGDTVESVVELFTGGIASACSYLGIADSQDLPCGQHEAQAITQNGFIEGLTDNQR